jgi:hypothetical protein
MFGTPLLLFVDSSFTTGADLYRQVWSKVCPYWQLLISS